MQLNSRELGTVLASLRFWQRKGPGAMESAIADGGGEFAALTDTEIDALCENINCGQVTAQAATPAEITTARGEYGCDDIRVDDDALAARVEGSDAAWVQAWVYLETVTT
jgi:hypothetical protein